ncbi:unnamed protein product, partial [Linum tenue]
MMLMTTAGTAWVRELGWDKKYAENWCWALGISTFLDFCFPIEMVSSLALKKLVSSSLLPSSLRMVRPMGAAAPSASRLFNTNAVRNYDEDGDERQMDVDRRSRRPFPRGRDDFLSEVFDLFSPTRSLSQVLNLMDQFMENPLLSPARSAGGGGVRRGWDARLTEEDLQLRVDTKVVINIIL